MKKILSLSIVALLAANLFTGCALSEQTTQSQNGKQYAKFTSSDRLYQIRPGDSYETVVATLGSEPYNVLSKQANGFDVYVYRYKIVERECQPESINQRGGESQGIEVYNGREEKVYLIFENNKLQSLITEEGMKSGNNILIVNNTLYAITRNVDGEYVIKPAEAKATINNEPEKKAGGFSLPIGNK